MISFLISLLGHLAGGSPAGPCLGAADGNLGSNATVEDAAASTSPTEAMETDQAGVRAPEPMETENALVVPTGELNSSSSPIIQIAPPASCITTPGALSGTLGMEEAVLAMASADASVAGSTLHLGPAGKNWVQYGHEMGLLPTLQPPPQPPDGASWLPDCIAATVRMLESLFANAGTAKHFIQQGDLHALLGLYGLPGLPPTFGSSSASHAILAAVRALPAAQAGDVAKTLRVRLAVEVHRAVKLGVVCILGVVGHAQRSFCKLVTT